MRLEAKYFIDSHKCSNAPAILLKMNRSLSPYPEFAAYKARSALLIPYVM